MKDRLIYIKIFIKSEIAECKLMLETNNHLYYITSIGVVLIVIRLMNAIGSIIEDGCKIRIYKIIYQWRKSIILG